MYYTMSHGLALIFDLGGVVFRYSAHELDMLRNNNLHKSPFVPIEHMVTLIKRCRAQVDKAGVRRHQLYILSNFNRASFEVLKRFHAPILDLFDGYVIAGQVGYAKPDQRIYEHLLDKYGLRASACVFVDDEKEKVAAACAVGMSGVVCDTVTTVEQAFAEHGVFKLE